MLLVFLGISLLILAVGIFLYTKFGTKMYHKDIDWIYIALNATGTVLTGIFLVAILILSVETSGCMVIDEKIAVYQEENAVIEEQISDTVANYMNYEQETFKEFKNESSIVLVSLFPELKSDTLVSKQIEIYTENNKKIKELKEQKLNYGPMLWWLCFGHAN